MKTSKLKKLSIAAGLAFAGLALTTTLRAQTTEVFLSGGNASSSVLFDRATNLFGGSFSAVYGASSSTVRTYVGTIAGIGSVQLDITLNGAVGGLQDLAGGNDETNAQGNSYPVTFVDSSTSPDAVDVPSSGLTALPTYVVPYLFIKSSKSADTAGITNLTQRQANYLEGEGTNASTFYFGGSNTNTPVYFIGRNSQSAVRTEIDLNDYFTGQLATWTTNNSGSIVLDTSADPGQSSGSSIVSLLNTITNGIGEIAVQNLKSPAVALSYDGVSYSVTNVEDGSYELWGYDNYYYITSGNGTPIPAQLAVIQALYQSVTNATFQSYSNPVFTNNFVPDSALQVDRLGSYNHSGGDGNNIIPITPL